MEVRVYPKRKPSSTGSVSPPWFSGPYLQVQCDEFPRFELVCGVCSTGGLRPPLLVGNASATGIVHIPAASSTGTSLRSGTCPAHMRIASADSIRSPRLAHAIRPWLRLRTLLQMCDSGRRKRCFSTGGLTPPRSWLHSAGSPEKTAAAVRTELRCKKRHSRCTNARFQERRASARRGFPNRICKCNATNFRVSNSHVQCTPRGAYAPRSWLHARHIACDMRFRFATADVSHGALSRPALGRECVRWANYAYSSCKFDRNITASGNAPSTHAYSSCGFDRSPGGLTPPLLVARCRAGAPNAERSERTADIGESRIGASLIGEWICLPPVALFAC
jgi:hypothetical protein